MNSLGLWLYFENYQKINFPKHLEIEIASMSSDWIIAVSSEKNLWICNHHMITIPGCLPFSDEVIEISCNLGLALILTVKGEVWLWGEDMNKSNLYDIEGVFKSETPIKMQKFSNSPIISISLGNNHAGAVCSEGFLYTWGKGNDGELGYEAIKSSAPGRVESANIFKAKQVLCGNGYTGICTQGGFLYIFGSGVQCECGGISGFPYTIPSLEEYYVKKAYTSPFGIIVITDAFKCYIVKGCLCLTNLRANKNIEHIATCNEGICGLTRDKRNIYVWTKITEKEWEVCLYKIETSKVDLIISGLGDSICILGENIDRIPGRIISSPTSCEASPISLRDNDKKAFEQLFGAFNIEMQTTKENIQKDEGGKTMLHALNKIIGNYFRKIKEYSYLQWIYKRAYASTYTPSILSKIIQRITILDKSFAFQAVYKFSRLYGNKNGKSKLSSSAAIKMRHFIKKIFINHIFKRFFNKKSLYHNETKYYQGINVLNNMVNLQSFKVILKILKNSNKKLYLKASVVLASKKLLKKMFINVIEKVSEYNQSFRSHTNPIYVAANLIKKSIFYKKEKYFKRWHNTKAKKSHTIDDFIKITNENSNAALILVVTLGKVIKRLYKPLLNSIIPIKSSHKLKYGIYLLSSCISKIQSKNISYSFNSIIRQKNKPHSIEILFNILTALLRSRASSIFQSFKMFLINKKNKNMIKIILILQAIQEKIKYRQVIRGYNSFKRCIFNKSIISDFGSEKSFSMQSMLKVLTSINSDSPILDFNSEFLSYTQHSGIDSALNLERKSSLHNFQLTLTKKFSDKLTQESKSSVVNKSKAINDKLKGKESVKEKRLAYAEALKERQKKKNNTKSAKEIGISLTSRKKHLTVIEKKETCDSLIGVQKWKIMKYKNGSIALFKVICKVIYLRARYPFNKLKYFITNTGEICKEKSIVLHKVNQDLSINANIGIKNIESIKGDNHKECTKRKSKELIINTAASKYNPTTNISKLNLISIESPIESPIITIQEDATKSSSCSALEPETSCIKEVNPFSTNNWKVKLYALGLNKLARTIKAFLLKKIKNFSAGTKNNLS